MTIRIENEEALTSRFGQWPSFHDAEIIRARFERDGEDAPSLECDIHLFEITGQIGANGCYVLKNHTFVTLRFCDIELEGFKWWNCQNAILGLNIEPAEPVEFVDGKVRPIQVTIPAAYGCDAQLKCMAVKVVEAKDFTEQPTTESNATSG